MTMEATMPDTIQRVIASRVPVSTYIDVLGKVVARLDDDLAGLQEGSTGDSARERKGRAVAYSELDDARTGIIEAMADLQRIICPNMRFPLGQILITKGVRDLGADAAHHAERVLIYAQHARGKWGLVAGTIRHANEAAVKGDGRLMSRYSLWGTDVLVITDADRSATTVMLAEEY